MLSLYLRSNLGRSLRAANSMNNIIISIALVLSLGFISNGAIASDNFWQTKSGIRYNVPDQSDSAVAADNFWQTPAIQGAGQIPPLPQSVYQPNRNTTYKIAFGFAFASSSAAAADSFWQTPAIQGAGQIHPLPQSTTYQPDRKTTYKVVFGLTKAADKPDQINPALERVARTVNLYVSVGVPLNHLKFTAVAYGPATPIALDNAHYRKQYGVANPNLPVIEKLRKAGVDIAVCGQAVAEHHYQYDWIDSHVTLVLSALTTIIDLQQKGYALVPL